MSTQSRDMWIKLRESLHAVAFFVGLLLGFGGCCLSGLYCAKHSPYVDFSHFNDFLNAQTYYYPTISQMVALAQAPLEQGKTEIIVGGNSVALGLGQGSRVWTRKLQALLGPNYTVSNFAMTGMDAFSGPDLAFLSLSRNYRNIYFVTVTDPLTAYSPCCPYDDYPYFWDAYYKGLLAPPDIQNIMDDFLKMSDGMDPGGRHSLQELQLGAWLDACFHFRDLWTTVGYRSFFTAWTADTAASFTKARMLYPDIEYRILPVEQRTAWINVDYEKNKMRSKWKAMFKPNKNGSLELSDASAEQFRQDLKTTVPQHLRRNVLAITVRDCPYFFRQFQSAEEQKRYKMVHEATARIVKESGCNALDAGIDYTDGDFFDVCHLSFAGGDKLAAAVASEIERMERRKD